MFFISHIIYIIWRLKQGGGMEVEVDELDKAGDHGETWNTGVV